MMALLKDMTEEAAMLALMILVSGVCLTVSVALFVFAIWIWS